jgi:hypothetical protein
MNMWLLPWIPSSGRLSKVMSPPAAVICDALNLLSKVFGRH